MTTEIGTTLRSSFRRLAREIFYTTCVSVLLLLLYAEWRAWPIQFGGSQSLESVRKAIAGHPAMVGGKALSVRGVDISKHPFTFFIITSPSCNFCLNSARFHSALVLAARSRSIPLFVVVPRPEADNGFLSSYGLQSAKVLRWLDLNRRPQGTPSVLLVDSTGIIRRIWLGELGLEEQSELWNALKDPSSVKSPRRKLASGEWMLASTDLKTVDSPSQIVVISLEERDSFAVEHPPGSINIPLAEIGVRASSELQHDRAYAVDCTSLPDVVCSGTLSRLRKAGFSCSAIDFAATTVSE